MSRSRTVFFGALSGAIITGSSGAQSISTISSPTKASLQTIGKAVPVAEAKPVLSLGNLRTTEVELPPKEETYEERMALRHKSAQARQDEISNALRKTTQKVIYREHC